MPINLGAATNPRVRCFDVSFATTMRITLPTRWPGFDNDKLREFATIASKVYMVLQPLPSQCRRTIIETCFRNAPAYINTGKIFIPLQCPLEEEELKLIYDPIETFLADSQYDSEQVELEIEQQWDLFDDLLIAAANAVVLSGPVE